jgi:DNA-directed RNA polymerase specialized sigma24 family protein
MSVSKPRPERRSRRRANDSRRALLRAILGLPVGPRDVFLLHRFGGMSLGQVSDHLHLGLERAEVHALLVDALVCIARAAPSVDP